MQELTCLQFLGTIAHVVKLSHFCRIRCWNKLVLFRLFELFCVQREILSNFVRKSNSPPIGRQQVSSRSSRKPDQHGGSLTATCLRFVACVRSSIVFFFPSRWRLLEQQKCSLKGKAVLSNDKVRRFTCMQIQACNIFVADTYAWAWQATRILDIVFAVTIY